MADKYKKISVIGMGYIGLPTAAIFASYGKKVIGVDVNKQAIDTINKGQIHIVEPELDALVSAAVKNGFLRATSVPEPADAFLIAVPTPFKGNHEPDLAYIESASKSIATVLRKGDLVILESTSPVGTTEQMASWLALERPDLSFPQHSGGKSDIRIAYCPERVLPGQVLRELVQNDRVIGGMTTECSEAAAALYKIFVKGDCIVTTTRLAEMCKLTENSFRDVNIAFANELSMICDKLNIDIWELIKLANLHPRVDILQPGPGVGGHCIAVDPWFIVSQNPDVARLIRTAREVNDSKPLWVLEKVKLAVAEFLHLNPTVSAKDVCLACFGLAFKPDIDDLRESPALAIVQSIASFHDGTVLAVEPNINKLPALLNSKKVELVGSIDAVQRANIIVILVNHKAFQNLIKLDLTGRIVVDTKGILSV